jgi:hypothetical protein
VVQVVEREKRTEQALRESQARLQADRWRARYHAALLRLRQAGIEITADGQTGAESYISCRMQWDDHIANLAPSMAYSMEEIDAAMSRLGSKDSPNDPRFRLQVAE